MHKAISLDKQSPWHDWHFMRKSRIYVCELKRHRKVEAPLCAVCPRLEKCRSFRAWYRVHKGDYVDFVVDIVKKFPEKYQMEVSFMAEKQHFVQIVDTATGAIERVTTLSEIQALTIEEKLALSRGKTLFIVSHRIEPIVKVELKRHVIKEPMQFKDAEAPAEPAPIEEVTPDPIKPAKPRTRKK